MKYLILESRAAYCVALGEDGRCVKCANMRYEVGDRVEDVVELKLPERRDRRRTVRMISLCAGLAACVCIAFFGWYRPNYAAYGTMRMSINPDVELTLSRTERVLDADALNAAAPRCWRAWTSPAWTPGRRQKPWSRSPSPAASSPRADR